MAGRSHAVLYIDGAPYPAYMTSSGGMTQSKTREVPMATGPGFTGFPNTMIEEPTGGRVFEPLELSFKELEDEGVLLDELIVEFQAWMRETDAAKRRKSVTITFYKDSGFSVPMGSLDVTEAWCKEITLPEGDRGSDDPREFSATLVHKGSEYKTVSA